MQLDFSAISDDQLIDLIRAACAEAGQRSVECAAAARNAMLDEADDTVAILTDVSTSMAEAAGATSKYEILKTALRNVWPSALNARLIAFDSLPEFLADPQSLPLPRGSTALHLAIEAAQSLHPGRTLVITDGRPDDKQAALDAADKLTGRIDVIYCGPDGDIDAISFLQRLARSTGGSCVVTPQNAGQLNLLKPVRRLLLLTE